MHSPLLSYSLRHHLPPLDFHIRATVIPDTALFFFSQLTGKREWKDLVVSRVVRNDRAGTEKLVGWTGCWKVYSGGWAMENGMRVHGRLLKGIDTVGIVVAAGNVLDKFEGVDWEDDPGEQSGRLDQVLDLGDDGFDEVLRLYLNKQQTQHGKS